MSSPREGNVSANVPGAAEEALQKLYGDQKLTELFGNLSGKQLLEKCFETYLAPTYVGLYVSAILSSSPAWQVARCLSSRTMLDSPALLQASRPHGARAAWFSHGTQLLASRIVCAIRC